MIERKARILDTSNIIHRNKTRSTGSVGKGLGSQLCHDWELHTRKQAGLFLPRTPDCPVVNSDERGKPVDGLEPVVLLGLELCENETDPVMPVSQDVILKEHNGLVDRSGPGATQSMTEPSAWLTLKTDWMENAALGPVGPDGNLSG